MRTLKITQTITRRDERSLDKYLTEISQYDLVSPEEEVALFKRIEQGDEQALQELVNANLRFVVSVAKQYHFKGTWLGDLVSEGNIGLMKAAKRFDYTRGFKFISYAVWWIRQSIINHLNERRRKIRLPANFQNNISTVRNLQNDFLQRKERLPSVEELATLSGLSEEVVHSCITNYKPTASLDRKASDDSDTTVMELTEDHLLKSPDHKVAIEESQKDEVAWLLNKLSVRDALVLKHYFGIGTPRPISLDDIGEMIGVSRERVRQIKDRALNILRKRHKDLVPTFSNN